MTQTTKISDSLIHKICTYYSKLDGKRMYVIICVHVHLWKPRFVILGKRHLIVNSNVWMKEMATILSKEFKTQGNHIRLSKNIHTILSHARI